MKAALYVRVSTSEQNTSLQIRELEEFAKARGWIISSTFEDKAAGTNDRRPQLKALMDDARARKIDIVLVWKLDRLARSLKHLVTTLQVLDDLGIQFVSLRDQIDLTTASGRLMMHIIAAFAEFEASIIKERVRAGLSNARHRGQQLGRPPRIDPFLALEMRNYGLSLGAIAKRIGVTRSAVSKTLSRLSANKLVTKPEIIEPDSDKPAAHLMTMGGGRKEKSMKNRFFDLVAKVHKGHEDIREIIITDRYIFSDVGEDDVGGGYSNLIEYLERLRLDTKEVRVFVTPSPRLCKDSAPLEKALKAKFSRLVLNRHNNNHPFHDRFFIARNAEGDTRAIFGPSLNGLGADGVCLMGEVEKGHHSLDKLIALVGWN